MLPEIARAIKGRYPDMVGINLLSQNCVDAFDLARDLARDFELDALWADDVGISSRGVSTLGCALLATELTAESPKVFGGIAFKSQAPEPNPVYAAEIARSVGVIPTTSGPATGQALSLEKIRSMSGDGAYPLAVASGMTPENVAQYAPYLSHILVSTGIGVDFHHIDEERLNAFISATQND